MTSSNLSQIDVVKNPFINVDDRPVVKQSTFIKLAVVKGHDIKNDEFSFKTIFDILDMRYKYVPT